MFGLSEIDYAINFHLSNDELHLLRENFNGRYCCQITVDIPEDKYEDSLLWLAEHFGPEDSLHEAEVVRWCRYHPVTANNVMDDNLFTSSLFGFTNYEDAIFFKLRWWP